MNILDKNKVDHLFLLIGENPLPNYVAARTLLTDGGTVYLVFTKQTISQKNCLKGQDGLLRLGINCEEVDLADDESNAYQIRDKIQKRVNSITNGGNFGLNYTGGTKAMAVHAYRAIQELKPNAIFSYLDPRRLKMWIHKGDKQPISEPVPLQLSLKELFNLHGKYLLSNYLPRSQPYIPDLAKEIAKVHENQQSEKKWKEWCNKLTQIADLQALFPEVATILSEYLDFPEDKSLTEKAAKEGFRNFKEFHLWINGTWLESYTLQQIKEISADIRINEKDSQMSFYITDDNSKVDTNNKEEDAKFEFDVAFIRGYQLFAITCTTKSKKSDCKEKIFEAYLRARELGGDEARVALVCCYDQPEEIEEDMTRFGIPDPKIKVFGRSHLANLADEIAIWIEQVEQEANA